MKFNVALLAQATCSHTTLIRFSIAGLRFLIPRIFFLKVYPDIMTLAKPLAGGLPIGAALLTQNVADKLKCMHRTACFIEDAMVIVFRW